MALKKPEGGFIESRDYENGYTQRIPTMDSVSQNQIDDEDEEEYEETFFSTHPKAKVAIIIGAILLALIAVVAVPVVTMSIVNKSTKAQDVQIPNVVGLPATEAKQRIESSKLVYKEEETYSVDVEAGFVISQNPKYGNYSIKEGTEITVVVSKGIETVVMPKVVGKQYSDVEMELKELGLQIEKIEEFSDEVEAGIVISQEDEKDAKVAKGATVKIHVSKGIEKVTVPSVEGKNSEEAAKELQDIGLTVITVTEEDTSKTDNTVLKQNVEAGSSIEKGSSIKLTVNKIEQPKQGNVLINVKSLANTYLGPEESTEAEEHTTGSTKKTTTNSNVKITVYNGPDKVYEQSVARNRTELKVPVKGKGSINVKVYIASSSDSTKGILAEDATMNLNEKTELKVE